jgi:hypothetical protein
MGRKYDDSVEPETTGVMRVEEERREGAHEMNGDLKRRHCAPIEARLGSLYEEKGTRKT